MPYKYLTLVTSKTLLNEGYISNFYPKRNDIWFPWYETRKRDWEYQQKTAKYWRVWDYQLKHEIKNLIQQKKRNIEIRKKSRLRGKTKNARVVTLAVFFARKIEFVRVWNFLDLSFGEVKRGGYLYSSRSKQGTFYALWSNFAKN